MRLNRRTNRNRGPGTRAQPQVIVLRARGTAPSAKPPVRIFVGTEPGQYRAERVFVWSIEQVRDPARTYEIHLMKDLVGFDRRRWLTGFTNYRFAIPHLAGGTGRAIYNDVDQLYLCDPAELFDTDMHCHGYLALSPDDTAVMLIDCARMATIWPLDLVRRERRKPIEARARAVAGLWGELPRTWHARDWEYEAGRTRVLHFTTIHTQPWQPFPHAFAYLPHENGHVWLDLEHGADRAGFQLFSADTPSDEYGPRLAQLRGTVAGGAARARPAAAVVGAGDLAHLLSEARAETVLDYTVGVDDGGAAGDDRLPYGGRRVHRHDPAVPEVTALRGQARFDAVVARAGLERIPEDDVPWLVDGLFAAANRLVYVVIADESRRDVLGDGTVLHLPRRPRAWWESHFTEASIHHPSVRCRLVFARHGEVAYLREWGPCLSGAPRVWILGDDKAGHTTQSLGLARALGWPFEVKDLRFTRLNRLSSRIHRPTLIGIDRQRSPALEPPWPDIAISTGRRAAPVARWIARQSRGLTRIVHLGRKGGERAGAFDAVVSCAHFRLPTHERRIETTAPLTAVTHARLSEAAQRWRGLFGDAPSPHVVLVVGGATSQHDFDAATARRLAAEVRAFAEAAGGTVCAITSPRTGSEATEALASALGDRHRLHRWQRGERDNPYLGHLALADVLVVTGESESMLAEAAAVGRPLYIYPLPEKPPRLRTRLREWVRRTGVSMPRKAKGTVRPQQGLEYYCARLIERGFVRTERDVTCLHDRLIALGVARRFGTPLERDGLDGGKVLDEIDSVAHRIRALLGVCAPEPREERRASVV